MNSRGSSEWTIGKLTALILVVAVVLLVVWGLSSGSLFKLFEQVGVKADYAGSFFYDWFGEDEEIEETRLWKGNLSDGSEIIVDIDSYDYCRARVSGMGDFRLNDGRLEKWEQKVYVGNPLRVGPKYFWHYDSLASNFLVSQTGEGDIFGTKDDFRGNMLDTTGKYVDVDSFVSGDNLKKISISYGLRELRKGGMKIEYGGEKYDLYLIYPVGLVSDFGSEDYWYAYSLDKKNDERSSFMDKTNLDGGNRNIEDDYWSEKEISDFDDRKGKIKAFENSFSNPASVSVLGREVSLFDGVFWKDVGEKFKMPMIGLVFEGEYYFVDSYDDIYVSDDNHASSEEKVEDDDEDYVFYYPKNAKKLLKTAEIKEVLLEKCY